MNLQMNLKLAENYTSRAQIARVLTENWLLDYGYCPSCSLSMSEAKKIRKSMILLVNHALTNMSLKAFWAKRLPK